MRCACSLIRSQRRRPGSRARGARRSRRPAPRDRSPRRCRSRRPARDGARPAGIRCRIVFSPSTTSVWPALLPPWKRTTMSASAARRSTTLPLPSSPHWAPMTTVAAMALRAGAASRRDDLRQRAQLGQHLGRDRLVDVEERHRHAADPLAAELEARDVDAALAEQRADAPDDARARRGCAASGCSPRAPPPGGSR